jgi:GH3 auxin-responsive promoter
VNVSWPATRRWLAKTRLARHIAEAVFRARNRCLLARFERLDAPRCQIRTLLSLVHRGYRSPFGRDHDFSRIRTVEDFRRLVPLRSPAELRRFPVPPVSPFADAARLAAVNTALAIAARERPRAPLFDGTIILLGDDVALPDDPRRVLPSMLQPFANTRGKLRCLIGSADRLARYLDVCRPDDRVTTSALLYTPSPGVTRDRLRSRLNPEALLLELGFRAEAAITVEDPRRGMPRLLIDHGVFFEFVPARERNSLSPPRMTLDEVDPGATYELVVTAPGGWWACRTGTGVCFESRHPALVRFVALPAVAASPVTADDSVVARQPAPLSHPQTSGIPAALPRSYVHTPWSAPAGRE